MPDIALNYYNIIVFDHVLHMNIILLPITLITVTS